MYGGSTKPTLQQFRLTYLFGFTIIRLLDVPLTNVGDVSADALLQHNARPCLISANQ